MVKIAFSLSRKFLDFKIICRFICLMAYTELLFICTGSRYTMGSKNEHLCSLEALTWSLLSIREQCGLPGSCIKPQIWLSVSQKWLLFLRFVLLQHVTHSAMSLWHEVWALGLVCEVWRLLAGRGAHPLYTRLLLMCVWALSLPCSPNVLSSREREW